MKRSINFNGLTAGGRGRARRQAFSGGQLLQTMQAVGMRPAEIRATLEERQPTRPKRWHVYYQDAEFARLMGDPLLGTVEAATREEAERQGASLVPFAGGGAWVVEDDAPAGSFADRQQNPGTNER